MRKCLKCGFSDPDYDIEKEVALDMLRRMRDKMYADLIRWGVKLNSPSNEYSPEELWEKAKKKLEG